MLSRRQIDGADVIVVDHPRVKASVALNGAHLLSKPEGETEVLWLSDATSFKRGGDPRRRACLLAMVWPVRAAGTAFSWFCPQPAVDPESA